MPNDDDKPMVRGLATTEIPGYWSLPPSGRARIDKLVRERIAAREKAKAEGKPWPPKEPRTHE